MNEVKWLEPVATHGPPQDSAGRTIQRVDRRPAYVPDPLPSCVTERGHDPLHELPQTPWEGFRMGAPAGSVIRRKGAPAVDFAGIAQTLGEFTRSELQRAASATANATRAFMYNSKGMGRLREIRKGRQRSYVWIGGE